jgi:pimeloyl-ACP methyl ester carboxylesterase
MDTTARRRLVISRQESRRPGWGKLLAEIPAVVRLLLAQAHKVRKPDPNGSPVIVIPGLLTHDFLTRPLRGALNSAGFAAIGWAQGLDRGARPEKFSGLLRLIDKRYMEAGRPVILIGWSLGGLYAREVAKRRNGKVDLVVTLGTPFSHGLRRNNAWKLYEAINDHDVDHPPIAVDPPEKPRVYTIACWSPNDGMVAPVSAAGEDGEVDERMELHCRHNELVSDPQTLHRLVQRLVRWQRDPKVG